MKVNSSHFIMILFLGSVFCMYFLYKPYLLSIIIAALLAISTFTFQKVLDKKINNRLVTSSISTVLLSILFFVPLGYFLITLTINLNHIKPDTIIGIENYIRGLLENPPQYFDFLKNYIKDIFSDSNVKLITEDLLILAGKIGSISASFLKNAFLIIIFYFFIVYNNKEISYFFKRVTKFSQREFYIISKGLSNVMSVVFYSIITTAAFEGLLFGTMIGYLGFNGLLFGIMYGFASLIPIVGGVLMWIPFTIYELSIGNTGNALFIALYSIIIISVIADTFVKPTIIKKISLRILKKKDKKINELIIFFAIIAGLTTFGFWGMILGPAITAFFLTTVNLFNNNRLK